MRPSFNFLRAKDWKPLDFEGGGDAVCVAQDGLKLWIFPVATQLPQGLAPHSWGFPRLSMYLAVPLTGTLDNVKSFFHLWGRRTKGHLLRRQGHLGKHPGRTLDEGGRGWRTEDDLCSRVIWVILCTPLLPGSHSWSLDNNACGLFTNRHQTLTGDMYLLPALFLLKASSAPTDPNDLGNSWLFQACALISLPPATKDTFLGFTPKENNEAVMFKVRVWLRTQRKMNI